MNILVFLIGWPYDLVMDVWWKTSPLRLEILGMKAVNTLVLAVKSWKFFARFVTTMTYFILAALIWRNDFLLQPRCKQLPEAENEKCEVRPHPEDACCKAMYCPDPDAMDNLKPVPDPFEGCIFKNETYNPGQRFFDGCEQQCECMGFSDMVCVSRYVSLLPKNFQFGVIGDIRIYCSCPRGRARIKFLPAWRKILARAAKPQGQEFFLQKGKNFIFARPLGQEHYSYKFPKG